MRVFVVTAEFAVKEASTIGRGQSCRVAGADCCWHGNRRHPTVQLY